MSGAYLAGFSLALIDAGESNTGKPLHRWSIRARVLAPTRGEVRRWADHLEDTTGGNVITSNYDPVRPGPSCEGYDLTLDTLPLAGDPVRSLAVILDTTTYLEHTP